jgi:dihydrofolate reductase
MPVSIIAAVAKNRAIGRDGKLPWRLPEDLAFFKRVTMGHPVIMGRKTMQSIGKPLSGRKNIVTARTVEEALKAAGDGEVFVIGGASVYELFFPLAARLYITRIEADFEGDVFFPDFDTAEWRIVRSEPGIVDVKNTISHRFVVFERIHT